MRQFFKTIATLGLLAAVIWTGWQVAQITLQKWQLKSQIQELKTQAILLEARNQNLEKLLEAFQNPALLELEMRQKFNLARKGEKVIVVLPNETAPEEQPPEQTPPGRLKTFFTQGHLPDWWNYFFNN
jgi:cell division protein FtsB